jgi:RIO kinase 2
MYDGYRLTYPGYDFLALRTLMKRGFITGVGRQIGVGKESDIFLVYNEHTGEQMALKLQRLGRVSFRSIKKKRDYLQHRKSASWLYMSFLGARKEFAFMSALRDSGFAVPIPVAHNRHAVLMSLVPGRTLANTRPAAVSDPAKLWEASLGFTLQLADHGLIHCDLNEFNIMFDPESHTVTLIDFPQMVSTSHPNAAELFERDVNCLLVYFKRRHEFIPPEGAPLFASLAPKSKSLDVLVEASGFFTAQQAKDFEALLMDREEEEGGGQEGEEEEEEEDKLPVITEEEGDFSSSLTNLMTTKTPNDDVEKDGSESNLGVKEGKVAIGDTNDELKDVEFISLSKDVLLGLKEEGTEEEGEEDDGDIFKEAVGEEEGEDEEEEEDGEEEEEESEQEAAARRKKEALDEAALASFRPPTGVRTMPGGRRIKPRGGEAYLNPRSSASGDGGDDDDERGSVISRSTKRSTTSSLGAASATVDDVRARVKVKLSRAKEKKERADVIGRALSSNDNKDKQNKKIRNMATYDMSWDVES